MMQQSFLRVSQRHLGTTFSAQSRRYAAGKDSLNLKGATKGGDQNGGAAGGGFPMLPVAVIATTTVAAGWYFGMFSSEEPEEESFKRPTLKRAATRSFPGFVPDSEHAEEDSNNSKLSRQKTKMLVNDLRSKLQRTGTQTKEKLQEAGSKLKRSSTRSFPGFIPEANQAEKDAKNAKLSRQKTQKLFSNARTTLQRSGTQTKESLQQAGSKLKRSSTRSFPGFIPEANQAEKDAKNAKLSRQKTQKLFSDASTTLQRSGTQVKNTLKRATTRSYPESTPEAKEAEGEKEDEKKDAKAEPKKKSVWGSVVGFFTGR